MNESPTIRVYVAGPLFGSGRSTANVYRAIQAAERVRRGHMYPFIPHLYHLWDTISPHDDVQFWLDMDRVWLEQCDAMVRLLGASPGSSLEEEWCHALDIPIFYEGNGGISQLVSDHAGGKIKQRQKPPQASANSFTLQQLQEEQVPWVKHNFGTRPAYHPLLGVGEELGELIHAFLKSEQGIRGLPAEHRAAKIDAVGDIVIYLADYCTAEGIDLGKAVEETWGRVRQRDWKNDPSGGGASLSPKAKKTLSDVPGILMDEG